MEPRLPTPAAAAAAATAQAPGPRDGVYDSPNRQQQLLRLAVQRQLQQEERQQQHLKQRQEEKGQPEKQHATLLEQQQQQREHQEEPQYHLDQQQQLPQHRQQQLVKCVISRSKGSAMEQSSTSVALGSGNVSTANSGSESTSRSASDDEAARVNQRPELKKKWAVEVVVCKEDRLLGMPNRPAAQQHEQKTLEPLYERQWQPEQRQQGQHQQHEQSQESQRQKEEGQQQQLHHQLQQRQEKLTQQQCRPEEPRQHFQQHDHQQHQQHQQQLSGYAEGTLVGKHLLQYAEEKRPGIEVGAAFLARRQLHTAAELPPLPPAFAHAAEVAFAEHGLHDVTSGVGCPGGPVRQARKKVQHSSSPACPPSNASSATKGGVRNIAGRVYRNSRITEVRSFAGTLEEYLLFRQQQAEREKATAAAARSSNSDSSAGTATQQLAGRTKAAMPCSGCRRAASAGRQDFTGKTAAALSSRSTGRAASACRWLRRGDNASGEHLDRIRGKEENSRSKGNDHVRHFFLWERNAAVQQQQRKMAQGIFQQVSRQTSESSQQGGKRISRGISATLAARPRDAVAAIHRTTTAKRNSPLLQLRTLGDDSSSLCVAREQGKTEDAADEWRVGGKLPESSAPLQQRNNNSSSQPEESQTDEKSGVIYGDTHTRANAASTNTQQQQATREDSIAGSEKGEAAGGCAEDTKAHRSDEKDARRRGRKFIPVEIKNGEIVWPTDRPIIPLNAWIFQNFSADEPLNPQNWVHLPNVGPAVSPATGTLQPAEKQSRHSTTRPRISCSTAPLVHSPLMAEGLLTEPVKLPPIKLSVGCEVPRFIIQTNIPPERSTRTHTPSNSSASTIHGKKLRSRSCAGRLGGVPPAKLRSVYTPFFKQIHVRHRPTNFEGLVVRTEDAGRVLLVRSKDGHLRKVHRDECEAVGFMCASAPPPETSLTDAAHVHATHLLSMNAASLRKSEACSPCGSAAAAAVFGSASGRSATSGASCAAASVRKPPTSPSRDLPRLSAQQEAHAQQPAPKRQILRRAMPSCPPVPRHRSEASRTLLNLLGSCQKTGSAGSSSLLTRNEDTDNPSDKQQTQPLPLQQVPDLQEVLVLAQQHANATMRNTVALKNMATIPAIRAVDSQITVEAIRVKKYTLEGNDEENLLPVFSGNAPEQDTGSPSIAPPTLSAAAPHDEAAAPADAARLLLQKHDARQVLKKREEQLMANEVIYAQDAPDATRAWGIAPPTIVKDSLVIPPGDDELFHHILQAPGIVPPLNQYLNETGKSRTVRTTAQRWPGGSDVSSVSTETPNMQHVNGEDHRGMGEKQERTNGSSGLLLHAEGPAWFFDLKTQFRNHLLQQYLQTGSMEAAALAVSSGGYMPLTFTASHPPAVQRKQAKVLRDELREIDFVPVEQNNPVEAVCALKTTGLSESMTDLYL